MPPAALRIVALGILAFASAAARPAPDVPDPAVPAEAGARHITIETIAVDRRGTWSAGIDEADIFVGSTGVLKRTVTLMRRGPGQPSREMVEMTLHVTPKLLEGGACGLDIKSEATSVVAGARRGAARGEPRSASVTLAGGEEKMVEVYASAVTDGRLALKVRCEAQRTAATPSDPDLVDFVLSIDRAEGDGQPEALKSDRLLGALGREASDFFSFNVPLPDGPGGKRYRREQLEVVIAPQLISAGRLQVEVRLRGEVATMAAEGTVASHPFDRRETLILASGEPRGLDFEVRATKDEGWLRVRYAIRVISRF